MQKTVYTLDIGDFAPEITRITFPLLRHFAHKIGADFRIISERKFPDWPVPVEKLQIFELGQLANNEWNLFFDADAILHPELFDVTDHLERSQVLHHGIDRAGVRFRSDRHFRRHGQNTGCCNWCTVASDWCIDLWTPPEMTPAEAADAITPTIREQESGVIEPEHLIDDYLLSRNVARFGLNVTTIPEVYKLAGLEGSQFFWHDYVHSVQVKTRHLYNTLPRLPGWGFLKSMLGHEERNGMRTAVVRNGIVENVIIANAGYETPGCECIPLPEGAEAVSVGWSYAEGKFTPPTPIAPQPQPEPIHHGDE